LNLINLLELISSSEEILIRYRTCVFTT